MKQVLLDWYHNMVVRYSLWRLLLVLVSLLFLVSQKAMKLVDFSERVVAGNRHAPTASSATI